MNKRYLVSLVLVSIAIAFPLFGKSKKWQVGTHSVADNELKKNKLTNEDTFTVIDDNNTLMVGVFDGHKGDFVSKYLQKHLLQNIKKMIRPQDSPHQIKNLIRTVFLKTDNDLKKYSATPMYCGAPGAIVIVRGCHVFVASIGSTRVIVQKKSTNWISRNHTPADPDEITRIEEAHGKIKTKKNMPVIVDECNKDESTCVVDKRGSRSFGDFFRDKDGIVRKPKGLTARPEIRMFDRNDVISFVVISDGIWRSYVNKDIDALSTLETEIRNDVKNSLDPKKIAHNIVSRAQIRPDADQDDMTAVCVILA